MTAKISKALGLLAVAVAAILLAKFIGDMLRYRISDSTANFLLFITISTAALLFLYLPTFLAGAMPTGPIVEKLGEKEPTVVVETVFIEKPPHPRQELNFVEQVQVFDTPAPIRRITTTHTERLT